MYDKCTSLMFPINYWCLCLVECPINGTLIAQPLRVINKTYIVFPFGCLYPIAVSCIPVMVHHHLHQIDLFLSLSLSLSLTHSLSDIFQSEGRTVKLIKAQWNRLSIVLRLDQTLTSRGTPTTPCHYKEYYEYVTQINCLNVQLEQDNIKKKENLSTKPEVGERTDLFITGAGITTRTYGKPTVVYWLAHSTNAQ